MDRFANNWLARIEVPRKEEGRYPELKAPY
jgi:hypothetical protein